MAGLTCLVCEASPCQAAHVRHGFYGMGIKPSDMLIVPLCPQHHSEQHEHNERAWWWAQGIDPFRVAGELARVSGDHEAGEGVVEAAKRLRQPATPKGIE